MGQVGTAESASPITLRVALLGNPNTGKSTLFNALSGLRQRVGNYPGVTVERKTGFVTDDVGKLELIDLPGTYSIAARSPDEMLAVDVLLGTHFSTSGTDDLPDVILSIVDASNLERNLYLTTQLFEVGRPIVIALTMLDSAARKGITVDAEALSRRLGVPVVPVNAPRGEGLKDLVRTLRTAAGQSTPKPLQAPAEVAAEVEPLARWLATQLPELTATNSSFFAQRLLMDVDGYLEKKLLARLGDELGERLRAARERLRAAGCAVHGIEAKTRYGWIRQEASPCVTRVPVRGVDWTARIDAVLTHRVWGLLIFLAVMFLIFQSIFTFAQPLMDGIDFGKGWLAEQITELLAPGPLRSLLVQGVLEGVGGVLIFLPQIMILFAFIGILEDCGYMARAAFLMDKIMSRCGLSGKSFIPLLSSFACAIPGIMAARVIEDRRDRFATILVAPLMSCSARLPVYLLLSYTFFSGFGRWVPGLVIFVMYLLGLIVAPLVAWALKRTLLRGQTPVFLMEMPPYRWPSCRIVTFRMVERGWAFIRRAGTIILATMILVWAMLYFPSHDAAGNSYESRLADMVQQDEELAAALESLPADAPQRAELEASQEQLAERQNLLLEEWRTGSYLGRVGKWCEPVFVPLGWDWRLTMAALASFPAREVVVGTLGIIYHEGEIEADDEEARARLGEKLKAATWDSDSPRAGQPVFTIPVALSVMIFFVFCCQCASTLAVLKRETNGWAWPAFAFSYMTLLAYLAALATFQIGSLL